MSSSRVSLEKFLIPLEEIKQATDNFSPNNMIGEGGFGRVYKGQLSKCWQNRTAAIKRGDSKSFQGKREFHNELNIISRLQHENIIGFIGYCDEDDEMIIVYEYAVRGGLDRYFQNPDKLQCVTWKQRLNICLGIAEGLKYLHSGIEGNIRVIHRDLKSANILLDDNMNPKITDFGLSKLDTQDQPTDVLDEVAGTMHYMDPFYMESGILSSESDIYTFGVVLFETLCGLPAYYERRIGDDEPLNLINLVRRHSELDKIIDPSMRGQFDMLSANMFKKIAYKCISHRREERPTMDRIIKEIKKALKYEDRRLLVLPPSSKHRPTRNNDILHKPPCSVSNLHSTWYNDIPHKPPCSVSNLRPSWAK